MGKMKIVSAMVAYGDDNLIFAFACMAQNLQMNKILC